jgi:selenide,water dikinase
LNADVLAQVLRPLKGMFLAEDYPDLLVGLCEPDDAAVWRIDAERALVVTTDFFTPVVDDGYDYGAIAAANALSDIYAMGGQPFLALNIAALPPDLPHEILAAILQGGAEKVREAGAVLAGGHTIQDKEPKFGLVALGFVHPEKMLSKGGARPGDLLVLSKPLGLGTLTTALKRGQAAAEDVAEGVRWMKRLNREAAQLANEFALQGGTDITGFSLLGHASEMAEAAGVGLRFLNHRIPLVRGALQYAAEWIFPGGSADNKLYYGNRVTFANHIAEHEQMLLFDAQTSGGLLLCVPPERIEAFMARAEVLGQSMWVVGEVTAEQGIRVE